MAGRICMQSLLSLALRTWAIRAVHSNIYGSPASSLSSQTDSPHDFGAVQLNLEADFPHVVLLQYNDYVTKNSSPVIGVADYRYEEYIDGSIVPVCLTQADTFWPAFFFIASISLFFALPFAVLVVLYTIIARHLMAHPGIMAPCSGGGNVMRYRKQVVLMLGTVVLSFFVCLLPFRALTLWIILVPPEAVMALGIEGYYNLLYFCRIMLYINSCINPILYNLMSSKFRDGFLRLCGWGRNGPLGETFLGRKGTFNTTSTTCSSSHPNRPSPDSFWRRSFTSRGSSIRLSLHNGSSPPTVSANGCLLTRGRNNSHYGNQHSVFLNRCGSVEGKTVCANNRRDESYV